MSKETVTEVVSKIVERESDEGRNQNVAIAKIVLEMVNSYYTESKDGVTQKELVIDVLKAQGKACGADDCKKMQPNVSKALKRLLKDRKVSCTRDKTYVPFDKKHLRESVGKQIAEAIVFSRDEIFAVSSNTLLLSVDVDYSGQCIDLVKSYLGVEAYFDVKFLNGYVIVFLRGENVDELSDTRKNLQDIVTESAKIHAKKRRLTK